MCSSGIWGALIVEQNEAASSKNTIIWSRPPFPGGASFIPYIFLIVIFALFWYFMVNKQDGAGGRGAMSFGKARAKLASNDKNKVTFDDVAGADEEKAELQEIVESSSTRRNSSKLARAFPRVFCWSALLVRVKR